MCTAHCHTGSPDTDFVQVHCVYNTCMSLYQLQAKLIFKINIKIHDFIGEEFSLVSEKYNPIHFFMTEGQKQYWTSLLNGSEPISYYVT